jgi:dolichyl-phosphate beta-glucosyltransferase
MQSLEKKPFVSIIIPAYNEEKRLPGSLHRIAEFLRVQNYLSEILVVENGSIDRTSAVVKEFCVACVSPDDPFQVHLLHSEKGKGVAIKNGMLAGQGDYLVMCDTDLAVPIEEINKFLPPALNPDEYDIAIASREVVGAVRHGEPLYRHLMGRVFNLLVHMLLISNIHDTQCGFKCFSRVAAQTIFPLQHIDSWGFDVETIWIALHHKLKIVEIPVTWQYGADSRVRPLQDTVGMMADLLRIRRYDRLGLYDKFSTRSATEDVATV